MAKQSGLGDNFYIAGYDLSGDLTALDKISGGSNVSDATGIKQSAHARLFLQRTGGMAFTSLFESTPSISTPGVPASNVTATNTNNVPVQVTITGGTLTNVLVNGSSVGTTAGTYTVPVGGTIAITYTVAPTWNWFAFGTEHNALSPLPRGDVIASYLRGTAIGNVSACMVAKQINYDPDRNAKGELLLKVELQPNAFGLEWGLQVTPGLRTDNAATNGSPLDNTASTAFGAQAYLQITELVGTNVDVILEHSPDNITYSTLIDFGSQTAIGAFRGSVSNVTTVNRYLRVRSAGTFTQAIFAVTAMRNPVAGVVF